VTSPTPPSAGAPTGRSWAALGALVAVFLWDSFLAGRAFVMRDAVFDFLPWRRFAAQAAQDGAVPLWNPYSRFGQPFVAGPQSGFFYPPHHLFDVLPVALAFKLTLALHLLVAAGGMHALLRRLGAATESALLAAVVFAFGGWFTAHLEFMSVMDTLAWAPWTIVLALRVSDARPDGYRALARRTLLLALVIALQVLAGQVQVLAFTCAAAATYGVAVALAERRRGAAVAVLVALPVAGLVAAGLCLAQILPTLELLPHSIRSHGVDPGLDIASMSPRHVVTLLFPFAFGRPGAGQWWGPTLHEFFLGCVHVGLAPLVAAFFVALTPKTADRTRRAAAAASLALLVVGLLVALGRHAPVYGWLQALPASELVRWPSKGLQLVAIALPVLAGLGFDALLARREAASGRSDRATLVALGVAGASALVLLVAVSRDAAGVVAAFTGATPPAGVDVRLLEGDARRSAAMLLLGVVALFAASWRPVPRHIGAAAVLLVSFANLLIVSREIQFVGDDALLSLRPPAQATAADGTEGRVHSDYYLAGFGLYGVHDETAYRTAAAVVAGNIGLPHGVSSTCPGDALLLTRAAQMMDVLNGAPPGSWDRLADVLAIDRVVRGPPFAALVAGAPVPGATPRATAMPRAYLVGAWERIHEPTLAVERLLAPTFDPRREAVEDGASGADPLPTPPAVSDPSPPGRVVALRRDWNRVELDLDVTRPGLLVLCETWFPGWTARVDGEERGIARVNVVFRGVPVRAGDRRVEMVYEPRSFRVGAACSLATLALVGIGLFLTRRRRVTT
jgi:hypothetical protein